MRQLIPCQHIETGEALSFVLFRDNRAPAYWSLVDTESGYSRTLERTRAESIPRVRIIIANHGAVPLIEL